MSEKYSPTAHYSQRAAPSGPRTPEAQGCAVDARDVSGNYVDLTMVLFWRSTSMNAACPECGAEIELGAVEVGEIVSCPDCGVDLEVLSVSPVELGLAPEEGEDWGE